MQTSAHLFVQLDYIAHRLARRAHHDVRHPALHPRVIHLDLNVIRIGLLRRCNAWVQCVVQDYRVGRQEVSVDELG